MTSRNNRASRAQIDVDAESGGADGGRGRGARLTINDIARLAAVSKKTVSRVINNSPLVTEETRAKVDAVIREHNFAPDPQARGLALRRAFLIGLIYDNPNPIYVVNMQNGVLDALEGTGFELVVRPCDRWSDNFLSQMRTFVERQRLAGVILPPSVSEDQALARLLSELESPFVRIASLKLDRTDRMVLTHDAAGAAAPPLPTWPGSAIPASPTSPVPCRSAPRTSAGGASSRGWPSTA